MNTRHKLIGITVALLGTGTGLAAGNFLPVVALSSAETFFLYFFILLLLNSIIPLVLKYHRTRVWALSIALPVVTLSGFFIIFWLFLPDLILVMLTGFTVILCINVILHSGRIIS